MSNNQETPKDDNFPGAEDVGVDELAAVRDELHDEEKSAELIVMSGIIPHVLERMLSFLPVSSLKHCRLVNTDWNKAGVVQLRKDLRYLYFPTYPHRYHDYSYMLNNKNSPFAKFLINPDAMDSHHVERLFNAIAPSATHLDISNDLNREIRFDPAEIYGIPEFPMLTNLNQTVTVQDESVAFTDTFDQFISKNEKITRMLSSTLFAILEKSPKLQNLKVELYYWEQPSSYLKDWLFESLGKRNNANLNRLDLHIEGMTDTDFSRLSALRLRLRSLFLRLEDAAALVQDVKLRNQCSFIDFLSSQSETLVHLELHGLTGVFDRLQFPRLKKIETLTIRWWRTLDKDFQSSPSINYEQIPSLKKLEIENCCNNFWKQFLPDASYTPVQTVEELKLQLYYVDLLTHHISEDTEIYVIHAAQYFPNLKVLREIPVNLKIANYIYKWLPRLEELTFIVGFTQSIDDIITGLSLEKCAALRLLAISEIRKLSVDNNEQDLDEEESLRPLSSLTHLKILRLKETDPSRNPPTLEFSRVSTLLVLTKMPSLETVDFGRRLRAYIDEIHDEIEDLEESGKSVLYTHF